MIHNDWPKGGSRGDQATPQNLLARGTQARTFRGQNLDYSCKDRNSAVSQLRNPYHSEGYAPRSTQSKKFEWNHWITCSKRSHQEQMSELQKVQPKSATPNGADQRQRFYHHCAVSGRIPGTGGVLPVGLKSP